MITNRVVLGGAHFAMFLYFIILDIALVAFIGT